MSKAKTSLILARGGEYLEQVKADPSAHPPEIKAMAQYVGVARRLFYKADPGIQKLVSQLEELRERMAEMPQALVLTPDDPEHAYTDFGMEDLNREIEMTLERAVWAAKKFVAQRSRGSAPAEAPLAAYDLDICLGQFRAAQHELRPLVVELGRRTGAPSVPSPNRPANDDLFTNAVIEAPLDVDPQ